MPPASPRRRPVRRLLVSVSAAAIVSLLPSSAGGAVSPPVAPLAASLVTASGAWAIVPTGHLADPVNTFWQLLFRPPGATRWAIVTPPGVADNGGLVIAPSAGGLTAGFEPSQNLKVSPLAITANGGASWTPGLVPAGLEALPDALVTAVSSDPLALVRTAGGTVLQGDSSLTTWSPVVGRAALARSAAGRSCGIGILSALATTGGSAVIGTACARPGVVGSSPTGMARGSGAPRRSARPGSRWPRRCSASRGVPLGSPA